MSKKNVPKELFELSEKHNSDIKQIIWRVLESVAARYPNFQTFANPVSNMGQKKGQRTPLSKKQLDALSKGRKKLAKLRSLRVSDADRTQLEQKGD